MGKKKLYYLLSNNPIINSDGGDCINELNNIKFLNNYFDIYYNNQLLDFTVKNLGQTKKILEVPLDNYDIYYVRNNKDIFLKLPKNKLKFWFASPYIESCYNYANKIVCLTENWKNMLLNVNNNWGILYPPNFTCLKTIVLSQKLDPDIIYYKKVEENIFKINHKINDNLFKICHFGSFRNSCYPSFFLKLYKTFEPLMKKNIKVIFIGKIDDNIKKNKDFCDFLFIDHIDFKNINDYINSSDLLLYNQRDYQSEYAGSNKIIEAIVCNKPILTCYSKARVDELGANYPLFYKLLYKPPDNPNNNYKDEWIDKNELENIKVKIDKMINNKDYYKSIVKYMENLDKKKFYNTYKNDYNIDIIIKSIM